MDIAQVSQYTYFVFYIAILDDVLIVALLILEMTNGPNLAHSISVKMFLCWFFAWIWVTMFQIYLFPCLATQMGSEDVIEKQI